MMVRSGEVLRWIKETIDEGEYLPPEVFEAHVKTYRKTSTEVVFFDTEGRIFLSYRPEENVHDPYRGKWHSPGVTHLRDDKGSQPYLRLLRTEISEGSVNIDGPYLVGEKPSDEPQRGPYNLRIHIARVFDGEQSLRSKGTFFPIDEIPYDQLVESHRNIVIPTALAYARDRGWIP